MEMPREQQELFYHKSTLSTSTGGETGDATKGASLLKFKVNGSYKLLVIYFK